MSVLVTAPVYASLFSDTEESFEAFKERARASGATVSDANSSRISLALSLLGFFVGIIAASAATSWGVFVWWPLGVAVALCYAAWLFYFAEQLRRVADTTTSSYEGLRWNMCQTLSLIFVAVALVVATASLMPSSTPPSIKEWIVITCTIIPTLLLSFAVWVCSGNSATVLSINIFLAFHSLVLSTYHAMTWDEKHFEVFAKWWLFGASMVALGVGVHIITLQDGSAMQTTKRNAYFLVEVASLVVWPTIYMITWVPYAADVSQWIFYEGLLVVFFMIAALSNCVIPLLIGITGVLVDVFEVYAKLARLLPSESVTQMAFGIIYLGGCAAALIVAAPYMQEILGQLSTKIKGDKSGPRAMPLLLQGSVKV